MQYISAINFAETTRCYSFTRARFRFARIYDETKFMLNSSFRMKNKKVEQQAFPFIYPQTGKGGERAIAFKTWN